MLSINVTSIRDHSEILKKLITEYESMSMNIALEIKNLNPKGWHDSNSDAFFAEMANQKIEIQKFVSSATTICDAYDEIVDSTVSIDSSIKTAYCDPAVQSVVNNKYNTSISNISNLLDRLQNLNTSFCTSGERSAINRAKNALNRALTSVTNSRAKVEELFRRLKELEVKIKNLLSSMDVKLSQGIDLSYFLNQ